MDVLNDDSAIVRLQALQTMHHMAVHGHLKVQEMHMHMVRVWLVLGYLLKIFVFRIWDERKSSFQSFFCRDQCHKFESSIFLFTAGGSLFIISVVLDS